MANKIYVVGGWNGQRGLKRCDIFDTEQSTWSSMAPLSTGTHFSFNCILIFLCSNALKLRPRLEVDRVLSI